MHTCTLRWSLLHSAPPAYDLVYRRPALLLGASSPRGTAQFPSSPSIVTVRYPGHSSAMPRTIRAESRRHGPCHAMIDGTDLAASARAQRKEKNSSLLHAISFLSPALLSPTPSTAEQLTFTLSLTLIFFPPTTSTNSSLPFPAFLYHRAIKKLETTVLFHFPSLHRLASKQCLFSASLTHTPHKPEHRSFETTTTAASSASTTTLPTMALLTTATRRQRRRAEAAAGSNDDVDDHCSSWLFMASQPRD